MNILLIILLIFIFVLIVWIFVLQISEKKAKANKIEQDYLRYKSERELWDEKNKQAEKEKKNLTTGTNSDRYNAADAILRNNKN